MGNNHSNRKKRDENDDFKEKEDNCLKKTTEILTSPVRDAVGITGAVVEEIVGPTQKKRYVKVETKEPLPPKNVHFKSAPTTTSILPSERASQKDPGTSVYRPSLRNASVGLALAATLSNYQLLLDSTNPVLLLIVTTWLFVAFAAGNQWAMRKATLGDKSTKESLQTKSIQGASMKTRDDESLPMGEFCLTEASTTFAESQKVPLLQVRGMDVFMTDNAEDCMAEHPFLLKKGLRDRPIVVVNLITAFCNALIYLELPEWVKDWDDIVEEVDDPDDVKALKRFLSGTDEYKNERLKLLLCLEQGPLPIQVVLPLQSVTKVPFLGLTPMLPMTWRKHQAAKGGPNGRFLHPCLEFELDFCAHGFFRALASIVRHYVRSMVVDVAVVIDKPEQQEKDEASCCVALWRFDKIDISTSPDLPPRVDYGSCLENDAARASQLIQSRTSRA